MSDETERLEWPNGVKRGLLLDEDTDKSLFPESPVDSQEVVVNGTTYRYVMRPKSKDDLQA